MALQFIHDVHVQVLKTLSANSSYVRKLETLRQRNEAYELHNDDQEVNIKHAAPKSASRDKPSREICRLDIPMREAN